MSKQSEAKERQNYDPKPIHKICSNCSAFTSVVVDVKGWGNTVYAEEKNMRCGIGGFAVKKGGTCNEHKRK